MSQLIKEVHEDHQLLKDKYGHESQKDHSAGFGGKFGIQKDRQDSSAYAFDHIEKLSKHTSQEMNKSFSTSSKKVISTSEESFERKSCDSNEDETNRAHKETSRSPSGLPPKPTLEPKSSQAIKDRIKAMSSRCDEKLSEKLTNTNKSANTQFTSDFKSERKLEDSYKIASESIRSMSKRFENMCQENQDNFKKLTEERRKEFFNEIKSQVKETRKGYDGFDTPEETPDNIDDSSRDASIPITNKCHNFTRKEVIKTNIVKEGDKIIRESTERNVETSTSQQVPDEIKKSEQNLSSEINNTEEGLKARTLFDYVASDDDEISFDAGEIITNIEKVDEGKSRSSFCFDVY